MISAFANSMKVPELRSRILFTLAMIVIVRLGVHLPLPGVDVAALSAAAGQSRPPLLLRPPQPQRSAAEHFPTS